MKYVSINPIQIEALGISLAKEPHELIAFQLLTSTCIDRQVCALVVGRQQVAMFVIDILTTLIFISPSDDIAM
jgi:hypothetical protein